MDYLYLRFGMQVCLRNRHSQKYLGFQEKSQTFNADSIPPYIEIPSLDHKTHRKVISLKFRIEPKEEGDKGKIIFYGSKVLLVDCETGSYLTTMNSRSEIGFDKPGLDEGMNNMLEKSATFTLLDEKNVRSKQSISVYDDVHLKSVYGRFLVCLSNRKVDNSSETPKIETGWNIMKSDTPYIPAWVYQRPTFSKFLNLNIEVDSMYGREKKQSLGSLPANVQEMRIIEDILDVMLGFDGEYIKKNSSNQFMIEPQKDRPTCSLALAELASKILALPTAYNIIENYISTYSIQQGTVCQALCSGLRQMIKQYKMMVISLDEQVSKKGLTMQQLWYYIQPSLQLMQSIVELVRQAQKMKGGQVISCIMKLLNQTTSEQVMKTYQYLFKKCMTMYIEMVSKWIYEGVVEDKYQEFMVMEEEQERQREWNCWEERFSLRRDQVPTLFAKDAHLILVTGKYLNIIKLCSRLEAHPFHKEIQISLDKSLKHQDFTETIMRAYDWANEKLHHLIFEQFKLLDVLKSMKGYYFLGFGDLFIHFMDSAEEDLNSKSGKFMLDLKAKPVSVEKLQNLFELLIRTSSANGDPYKEEVICRLQSSPIYQQIHKIKILQHQKFKCDPSEKPLLKRQSKYVDYFNLQYSCAFPLNLIINRKNLSKYQVLFRFIFWCKFIQRQLNSVWLNLQATKMVNMLSFKKANLLTQKMLNYIKSLIYYLSYEVIEHNWLTFQENLRKVRNFEDIIQFHNDFLNKCLVESLLVNEKLLQIITIDLGNACQGFINIKRYVEIFNPQNVMSYPNQHESSLVQRNQRRTQVQKYFASWHQESDFQQFIFGYNDNFDKAMKKLLRQIHSMVGKHENHLMGLLNKLDEKKFYDRTLFEQNQFRFHE